MGDELDDIFGDAQASAGGAAAGSAAAETAASSPSASARRDSELDNLFSDIGLDSIGSPTGGSSDDLAGLDDVDAFISGLTDAKDDAPRTAGKPGALPEAPAMADVAGKEEFLSWLEDNGQAEGAAQGSGGTAGEGGNIAARPGADTASSGGGGGGGGGGESKVVNQQDDEDEDEDEEEEEGFYLDQSGGVVVDKRGADGAAAGGDGVGAEGGQPPPPALLPAPVCAPLDEDTLQAARAESVVPQFASGTDEGAPELEAALAKVQMRVETLFDIGQRDATALRSAVTIKGLAGYVVPAALRPELWLAALQAPNDPPEWAGAPSSRLAEIFPSVRKGIRRDCAAAWAGLSGGRAPEEESPALEALAGLVSRLVLRNQAKSYNILLSNVAVTAAWVCAQGQLDQVEAQLPRSAALIQALSVVWGGRHGDWSNTGLHTEPTAQGLGVGGAAWAGETLPLVAFRRRQVLTKLVAFHDPLLACHLESSCTGWTACDVTAEDEDPATPDSDAPACAAPWQQRTVDRVLAQSATQGPLADLFGLLAPARRDGSNLGVGGDVVVSLWDAVLLSGLSPQTMAFFLAAAAVLLVRNKLLETSESAALGRILAKSVASIALDVEMQRGVHRLCELAAQLAHATPPGFVKWISEEELLLQVPEYASLRRFDEARSKVKQAEHELLQREREAKEAQARAEAALRAGETPAGEAGTEASTAESQGASSEAEDEVEFVAPGAQEEIESSAARKSSSEDQLEAAKSRARWFSSALKRRAENLKTAVMQAAAGNAAIDWSKVRMNRRLVEFSSASTAADGPESVGLVFRKGRFGLEVAEVVPDSAAARTGLVHPGDLVMTLNGLLVVALSAADAEALVALQERPFYMVLATLLPNETIDSETLTELDKLSRESSAPTLCPSLAERVAIYYGKYNRGKEREVDRILSIYSHREAVLLEELAQKYMDHVEGDPFFCPVSLFVAPMSPRDVVPHVCFREQDEYEGVDSSAQPVPARPRAPTAGDAVKKVFLIDCRPANEVRATGKFHTSFELDPATLDNAEVCAKADEMFQGVKGDMQVCIMGAGSSRLLGDFDPRRARLLHERDRRAVDAVALYFMRRGFPFVSVVEGGFLGCYMAARDMGYALDDCLVAVDGGTGPGNSPMLAKFDAFMRYHKSSPSAASAFLASKARRALASADGANARNGDKGAGVSAISSLWSNVFKKQGDGTQASGQHSEQQPAPEAGAKSAEAPAEGGAAPPLAPETRPSSVRFFSSVWKKAAPPAGPAAPSTDTPSSAPPAAPAEGAAEAAPAQADGADSGKTPSGWASGWSSRLKGIKVPDTAGLSSKLRTSVNQAYVTAQAKLASVATELQAEGGAPPPRGNTAYEYESDLAVLAQIEALKKEDVVAVGHLGRGSVAYEVEKEKTGSNEQTYTVKRLLVVSTERFLVLDPHPARPGFGFVKSNRSLKDVARMRYPNDDPTCISLFYKKGDEQVSYLYHFKGTDAKRFTNRIMHACARFNSRQQKAAEASKAWQAGPDQSQPKKTVDREWTEEEDAVLRTCRERDLSFQVISDEHLTDRSEEAAKERWAQLGDSAPAEATATGDDGDSV